MLTNIDVPDRELAGALVVSALAYAVAGWPVLALHTPTADGRCSCRRQNCPAPGKHPRLRHGFRDASTDPAHITGWWQRWPRANIGVRTGRLVVLDVDGAAGTNALADLEHRHQPLPDTRRVRTARGEHIYFHADGNQIRCSAGQLGPGLDIRGHGGYIVAPPSRHASGHRYTWTATHELAPIPAWLAEQLQPTAAPVSRAALPPTVTNGDDGRARRYLQAALNAEAAAVADTTENRNNALNRAAFRLGQLTGAGLGPNDHVTQALLNAALTSGLGESEARATITSGLRAGHEHPRPLPNDKPQGHKPQEHKPQEHKPQEHKPH